jgi:hypothetical protein
MKATETSKKARFGRLEARQKQRSVPGRCF